MRTRSILLAMTAAITIGLAATACGGGTDRTVEEAGQALDQPAALDGVSVISPLDGATILAHPPDDLVVLDVRTAEEFAEGRLQGATVLDFYAPDFADRLAELDRDVPYLIYCRSGNRSGQTRAMMDELGFTRVADVDGGILAWADADLPVEP